MGIVIGVIAGIVVVLFFVGILAAIAIPNMITAMHRARQKRSMADMRAIAAAIETHRAEKGAYPTDVSVLGTLPERDGWATPFRIEVTPGGYFIASAGADKSFDKALDAYTPATTDNFDCDVVFANGSFVQQPEGVR